MSKQIFDHLESELDRIRSPTKSCSDRRRELVGVELEDVGQAALHREVVVGVAQNGLDGAGRIEGYGRIAASG